MLKPWSGKVGYKLFSHVYTVYIYNDTIIYICIHTVKSIFCFVNHLKSWFGLLKFSHIIIYSQSNPHHCISCFRQIMLHNVWWFHAKSQFRWWNISIFHHVPSPYIHGVLLLPTGTSPVRRWETDPSVALTKLFRFLSDRGVALGVDFSASPWWPKGGRHRCLDGRKDRESYGKRLNPHLRQWVWLTCGSEIFHSTTAVRLHHLRQWNSCQTLKADHLRQWDFGTFVLLLGWGGVGWGGIITFMFQYTHRHGNRQWSFIISYCWGGVGWAGWGGVGWDNNVHVPAHTQARQQAVVFHHQLLLGWGGLGGVGWDGIITFMFLYTHRHGNRQRSFIINYCWGGVGWDNNVHVPVHTQAWEQAVVFHHQLLLGWGGLGWDNNVHVPVHTQARQQAVVFHHQLLLGWGGVG